MASIPLVLGFEFEEISEEQMSFTVAGRIVVVNPIHGDKVYWVLAKAWANCHDFQGGLLHCRLLVDVTKPSMAGFWSQSVSKGSRWISLKYERL
ncbi:hypothetical protein SLEP1_g39869 [Rubroshorea leprosula]|uniref:Uncharacterized protein n=1 Tax=Rubroshorea leprosula TaxID=152421 RepID=A0AAV5L2B2_9ROSI|nr:hypothetical protein SLEP1_g39869 [Rubroshorea leprosula]